MKDADAFEFHDSYCEWSFRLSHAAMMCLLKLRLLFDIQALKSASTAVGDRLPQELVDEVRSHMVSSSTCSNTRLLRDIGNGKDLASYTTELESQIEKMWTAVQTWNGFYWKAVAKPGKHLDARPDYTSQGDAGELQVSLKQTHAAWAETPGALQWVKDRVK